MLSNDLEQYIIQTTPARTRERYAGLAQAARNADYGALDEVVVIDTETTGVSQSRDELTQIAAARLVRGAVAEWYVTFVNPGKPIPDDIARLTNIHDGDVHDAPAPAQALEGLVRFVGDSYLVAHNAAFDKGFCTRHPEGAALASNVWVDSLDLARIALPRLRSHRLIDLVHAFGAPASTHRADDDVAALCAVYRILLAAVDAMPVALVAAIAAFAPVDVWPTGAVFRHFADRAEKTPSAAGQLADLSLRRIRQENVGRQMHRARPDAADLAADPDRGLRFAAPETIEQSFSADGIAGAMYEGFEPRDEQAAMALAVNNAFASSEQLVVEAGTGVGKSLAYLVPACHAAQANNITIGVATKSNALLDQLVNRELPLLSQAMGGISFASLKGFSHYPCLRRVQRLVDSPPLHRESNGRQLAVAPALAGLLSFIEQTDYDDLDGLKVDYRALPRYEITTTSRDCLRRRCPFFGVKCFVHGARLRAEASDVLVTNHSLLFCDVAAEGGLLPPVRYWVVDEAHGAESEARAAFSRTIDTDEIRRLLVRISSQDPASNVYLRAARQAAGRVNASEDQVRGILKPAELEDAEGLGNSWGDTLLFGLCARARSAAGRYAQAAQEFCTHVHDLVEFDPNPRKAGYDHVDVWISDQVRASDTFAQVAALGRVMCDASDKVIAASQELVAYLEDVEGAAAVQRDVASVALALKDLLSACELILFDAPDTHAYAAHVVRGSRGSESLEALLMNVGDAMNAQFYDRAHSVVFTSATMAVGDSFEAFNQALGLGQGGHAVRTLQLDSSYDFDANMVVYVADDLPEPQSPDYLDALNQLLVGVHRAQGGSTLTLFTNRREMEKCHSVVQAAVKSDDLRIVCQKWGVSVKGLRDDFLADEHLSLFALKSFWEGFDAPGATLKAVVIPKLPFGKPTDPLSCQRAQVEQNAWLKYVLPAAVIETKQAAGRLLRSSTDTGCLVLADRRLVTKGYGKTFLRSLPSRNIHILPSDQIIQRIAQHASPS